MVEKSVHTTIDFVQQYSLLREKEGRVYSDEEVAALPEIKTGHKYYNEWLVRKDSSHRLIKYLARQQRTLEILEVGCGNGWLSARLSAIPMSGVTGIDIHTAALSQARRVFGTFQNLEFFNCSLRDQMLRDRRFDTLVFAASVQYFPSFKKLMNDSLECLKPRGEIHIIDSHLYKPRAAEAARGRTRDYYNDLGFPEMADQYYHHSFEDLKLFNYEVLYDPGSFVNRLNKNRNPFYWICIKSNA